MFPLLFVVYLFSIALGHQRPLELDLAEDLDFTAAPPELRQKVEQVVEQSLFEEDMPRFVQSVRSDFVDKPPRDISSRDGRCVMCQFFVQRILSDLSLPLNLEDVSKPRESKKESFVEVESTTKFPNSLSDERRNRIYPVQTDQIAFQMFSGTYRVIDVVLESLCESNMPKDIFTLIVSLFQPTHHKCQPLFAQQQELASLIVSGRRNPIEICGSLKGVCDRSSYVFRTKHGSLEGAGFDV